MITVWGRATSSNVQIVMWALGELGLEHKRLDVGGQFGGTDTPEYLAMNPNGLIPVLRDGETVLFESAAILRYLGASYGDDAFWPADPGRRAVLDQWAEWTKTTIVPLLTHDIFWQLVRTPAARRDMARVDAAARKLTRLLPMIEARIGDGPYLGGNDLTFADVVFGQLLYRYEALDFPKVQLPRLDAYYRRLTQRPAYAEHVMVPFDSLYAE